MSKDVIIANSEAEAGQALKPEMSITEDQWRELNIALKEYYDTFPFVQKVFQNYYGQEGNAMINKKDIVPFMKELNQLKIKHECLAGLTAVANRAIAMDKGLYFAAD